MAKISRDEEVDKNDGERKNRADQAVSQHAERAADIESESSRQRWSGFIQRFPEKIHRQRKPEAKDGIGKKNAGKAEDTAGGQQRDRCIEACLGRCEETPSE